MGDSVSFNLDITMWIYCGMFQLSKDVDPVIYNNYHCSMLGELLSIEIMVPIPHDWIRVGNN